MKNRIIALGVGMILLLFSSLSAQAPDTLWTKTFGGTEYDECYSVIQATPDGGYIMTGFTNSYGVGESDVYLVRTNPLGEVLWTRTYGGIDSDSGNSIAQTADGGYIIGEFGVRLQDTN